MNVRKRTPEAGEDVSNAESKRVKRNNALYCLSSRLRARRVRARDLRAQHLLQFRCLISLQVSVSTSAWHQKVNTLN